MIEKLGELVSSLVELVEADQESQVPYASYILAIKELHRVLMESYENGLRHNVIKTWVCINVLLMVIVEEYPEIELIVYDLDNKFFAWFNEGQGS